MLMDWEAILRRWHESAVNDLKKTGSTPFMLHIYPEHKSAIVWIEPDGLSDAGRARIEMMNSTLPFLNPMAVLVVSDTWTPSEKFYKHYGLDLKMTTPGWSFQKLQKGYWEVLDREYKGRLANVPQELKSEAVMASIKGPRFLEMGILTFYHRENGRAVVDRTMGPTQSGGTGLVEDWWKSAIQ